MPEKKEDKEAIRERLRKLRDCLSPTEIEERSANITAHLLQEHHYKTRKSIMCYSSFGKEVDTHRLLAQIIEDKGSVILPYTDEKTQKLLTFEVEELDTLIENKFGIKEPDPTKAKPVSKYSINLVICPGIAFDKQGHRIGFGKGYFDRFLANLMTINIGLCYDFQIVESIEKQGHDVRMDYIITESRIFDCSSKSVSEIERQH